MKKAHPRKYFFRGDAVVMMDDGNLRQTHDPISLLAGTQTEIGIFRAVKYILI